MTFPLHRALPALWAFAFAFGSPALHAQAAADALPEAPAVAALDPPAPQDDQPLRLPRHWQPEWAVERSHVGDKLRYGFGSLVSIRNLIEAGLIAGAPVIQDAPHQPVLEPGEDPNLYQLDMDAYGHAMTDWLHFEDTNLRWHARRLEDGLATAETRQLLSNLALPLALHQEARYRPAPIDSDFSERMENAAESIVVTHDDHGRLVPNYSKLVGTVAAGWLGSHTYATVTDAPELHRNRFFLRYTGYSLAGDLLTNAAHEVVRAGIQPDLDVYNLHGRSTEDSYYPLSAGAKTLYWARSTYAPRVFVQALLTASLFTIPDQPTEPTYENDPTVYNQQYADYGQEIYTWRQDLETTVRYHGRRLYGGLATVETQQFIQNFAVPIFAGIDPRYIPLGSGYESAERFSHAFTSLVTARTDDGGHSVNAPVLLGVFGSAILAKEVYYPQFGTPALASGKVFASTVVLNLAADVAGNLWSEFVHHRGY